ncbi:uncharacterized protein N0V89_003077 [Didymosphaeria variabile]|uniref:Uncharacterized protein n=1 Tax=Didymosphaeria variabile TaxID=1932322 RepID=A0A9W9CF71_9PLEO|nr:uncharacterized protein N0V89_003077 [Didymosphaeria variabile]KAJ4358493.1 hypothetical protein N0V89_003077 [Didymosphaeria variabile]
MAANAPDFKKHLPPANVAWASEVGDYGSSRSASMNDCDGFMPSQMSEIPTRALQETHNLVELLEAATTAAEKAQVLARSDTANTMITRKGKRKRSSSNLYRDEDGAPPGLKRARVHATATNKSRQYVARGGTLDLNPGLDKQADNAEPSDTNTPGIHSAVALFRRPSEKVPRKYTRLPMSKLFMSLQLSPESFLHLQAEAKSYMLDSAHPERQSCVGNRGKSDTDMVKLRLFNCVRGFLDGGAGERFFGEGAASKRQAGGESQEVARALGEEEVQTDSDLVWPRDGNKLISLVTPLLRRMVTNERQRVYAIETRKGGARGKEDVVEAADGVAAAMQQQDPSISKLPSCHGHDVPGVAASSDCRPYFTATVRPQPRTGPDLTNTSMPLCLPFAWSVDDPPSGGGDPPNDHDRTPHIKHLNVFLKTDRSILGSVRFRHTMEALLIQLSWADLLICIGHLMEQYEHRIRDSLRRASVEIGPDTLRGLAVAATKAQIGDGGHESMSLPDTEFSLGAFPTDALNSSISDTNGLRHVSAALRPEATPRVGKSGSTKPVIRSPQLNDNGTILQYRIEAMRSMGRVVIENDSDWEALKLDVASADWADQTLNAIAILQ